VITASAIHTSGSSALAVTAGPELPEYPLDDDEDEDEPRLDDPDEEPDDLPLDPPEYP